LIFIYASYDGHLMARDLAYVPPVWETDCVSSSEPEDKHTHGQHLSIPLAIKSIISGSTDLPPHEKMKIHEAAPSLSEPQDIGILIEGATPCGMNARSLEGGELRGIVWFHKDITVRLFELYCALIMEVLVQVFEYANHCLKSLLRFPAVDIREAIWIDDGLFLLRFEVSWICYIVRLI